MKKVILRYILALIMVLSGSLNVTAQMLSAAFEGSAIFVEPVGTKSITFTTSCTTIGDDTSGYISFGASTGVTSIPTGVDAGFGEEQWSVKVFVNLDSFDCGGFLCPNTIGDCLNIYCHIYNPDEIGHVHLISDTINFGAIQIGTYAYRILTSVSIDTDSSVFRNLAALNVQTPFSSVDSITPSFGNCSIMPKSDNEYNFRPTKAGHYIDTTYLYDPTRKDSTMLILIGDGVAAGVAESTTDKPAMQVYPNPCDQFANIVLPPEGLEQVEIRNALGAMLQSYRNVNSDLMLDVSSLPGGIYFIEARAGDAVVTKKLVVIH